MHQLLLKNSEYSWGKLETLYIGGGTPSLWGTRGLDYLHGKLLGLNIALADNCEFTLEMNPKTVTSKFLTEIINHGCNRVSVGLQSLNEQLLKRLGRIHSVKDSYNALENINKNNLEFSVDIMLGLPDSDKLNRNVLEEVENVLKYRPGHISLYILTVSNDYKLFNQIPDEEWIEREYLEVSSLLKSHGYLHYEVSNFAKPERESRHNLKYWNSRSVAALGPSATGVLKKGKGALRYKWGRTNARYTIENVGEEQLLLESFYMKIRTNSGVKISDYFNESNLKNYLSIKQKWMIKCLQVNFS